MIVFSACSKMLPIIFILVFIPFCMGDIPLQSCTSTRICQEKGIYGHVFCQNRSFCKCINDALYDKTLFGCYKNIRNINGDTCDYDEDCGIKGSICEHSKCQCPKNSTLMNDSCVNLKKKFPRDFCTHEQDCGQNAQCDVKTSGIGICKCQQGYIQYKDTCILEEEAARLIIEEQSKLTAQLSICLHTEDCSEIDMYSRCVNGSCSCLPGYMKEDDGKCLPQTIGLSCTSHNDCQLINHSVCEYNPYGRKICICRHGYVFNAYKCMIYDEPVTTYQSHQKEISETKNHTIWDNDTIYLETKTKGTCTQYMIGMLSLILVIILILVMKMYSFLKRRSMTSYNFVNTPIEKKLNQHVEGI